jgi:hypothetical protein
MITIPDNNIIAIAYDQKLQSQENIDKVFESLKGNNTRDWFINHAYHCLPLVIGNQYGFVVKSLYDFEAEWNGGNAVEDVNVTIVSDNQYYKNNCNIQNISSHFGMGVITVQMAFSLRTSPGTNLVTINPPNYFIDGLYHMTGVVETDNLRRDFTFNLRLTRQNYKVKIKIGDYIGCIIPYPRHYIDNFKIIDAKSILDDSLIKQEVVCMNDFAIERSQHDKTKPNNNGKRYWRGEDVYGNKFFDHQINLDK